MTRRNGPGRARDGCSAVLILTLMLAACAAQAALDGPDQVLVGTDVVAADRFRLESKPRELAGTYSADQGGATVSANITEADGRYVVTLTYQEPGLDREAKTYSDVDVSGSRLHAAAGFEGRVVKEGLLVRDTSNALSALPPDLWILLTKGEGKE